MSEQSQNPVDMVEEEHDSDSRVDMWCSVALVLISWAIAIFWVSGQ